MRKLPTLLLFAVLLSIGSLLYAFVLPATAAPGQFIIGNRTVRYSLITEESPGSPAYTPICLYKCYLPLEFNLSQDWTVETSKLAYYFNWTRGTNPSVAVRFGRLLNATYPVKSCSQYNPGNGTVDNCSTVNATRPEWTWYTPAQAEGFAARAGVNYRVLFTGQKRANDSVDIVPRLLDYNITEFATWEGVTVDDTAGLVAYWDFNSSNAAIDIFSKRCNLSNWNASKLVDDAWGNAGEGLYFNAYNYELNTTCGTGTSIFPNSTLPGMTMMFCGKQNISGGNSDSSAIALAHSATDIGTNGGTLSMHWQGIGALKDYIHYRADVFTSGTNKALGETQVCYAFMLNSNGTETNWINATVVASRAATITFASGAMFVGPSGWPGDDTDDLPWQIDWVGVWNRSLNATEVSCMVGSTTTTLYGNPLQGGTCGAAAAVTNTAPVISFVNFNAGSFAGNETVRCGGIGADADGDNLTYNITFRVNGTLLNSSIFSSVLNGSFINVTLSDTALYNRSDRVNCTLQVNDSDATPIWSSNQTVIRNAEPSLIGSVNLTGDDGGLNRTNANLTLAFGCADSDAGDSCNAIQRITWWLGQANRTALDNLTVLHMGNTTRGDVWLAGVQVSDGWNASSLTDFVNASNITILNTPPAAVVLTAPANESNVTATTVIFGWNASADADTDPVNYTWWLDTANRHGDITGTGVTVNVEPGFHNWSVMASDATDDTANSTFAFYQGGGGPGEVSGGGGGGITLNVPVRQVNQTLAETIKAFSFRGWLGDMWQWVRLSVSSQRPALQITETGEQQLVYQPPPFPDELRAKAAAIPALVWVAGFLVAIVAVLAVWHFVIVGIIFPGVSALGGWPALLVTIAIAVLIAWLSKGG